jgi:hypothetical protein
MGVALNGREVLFSSDTEGESVVNGHKGNSPLYTSVSRNATIATRKTSVFEALGSSDGDPRVLRQSRRRLKMGTCWVRTGSGHDRGNPPLP